MAAEPRTLNIGGNTAGVNTFAGLDIGDLTGGVYNSMNLLNGDNFICFCRYPLFFKRHNTHAFQTTASFSFQLVGSLTMPLGEHY